ncbi:hypothetical protein yrohd0001_23320 [Yersinia rohdei ATCC 43380]|nr:hypothetical protein yrohd0001_23320 [Yersinia rohdei ATCC 43380]
MFYALAIHLSPSFIQMQGFGLHNSVYPLSYLSTWSGMPPTCNAKSIGHMLSL